MALIINDTIPTFNVTPYRVSTITITGGINSNVKLDILYDTLYKNYVTFKEEFKTDGEITDIEYGENKHFFQISQTKTKNSKRKTKDKPKKRFNNQLTIIVYMHDNSYNIKLFRNGNLQMTGVKNIEIGNEVINYLMNCIKNLHLKFNNDILSDIDKLENINYKVRLINCDFKVNFQIRLDYLYRIITKEYGITCSYEPCIYPGAKIEYYYPNNGLCLCEKYCNGKKDHCKKITIAVFQSGNIIITGANKIEHVNIAYKFICDILELNVSKIYRKKLIIS